MKKEEKNNRLQKKQAQATLEFAFCFIVVMLLFYSCVKAMQWVGIALVRPRIDHQEVMRNPPNDVDVDWGDLMKPLDLPEGELPELDLVYQGNIFKGQ